MQLDLRLCPSQCQRAINGCGPAIFICEFNHFVSSGCDYGGKNNARCGPGRNLYRSPHANDRVEYETNGARKRPPVEDRDRVAHMMPATDKSRPVCLELQVTDSFTLHSNNLRCPNGSFFVG